MLRYAVLAAILCTALVAPATEPPAAAPVITTVAGALSTADKIVILVPGVGTTPENLDRTTGAMARSLYAATASARVAVVAWLGYRPPEGLGLAAAQDVRARAGADALDRYVDALVARRPAASITLVGHSYGALVVGFAAASLPSQVTNLVALGAPGMGTDDVAGLHTRARVWAAQAPDDWIRWVPPIRILHLGHGVHPADPSFGANILPTAGVTGHDGYLSPGSATLTAVAGLARAADTR